VIPDLETSDVQLKGPPAKVHRDPFHQRLVLREDRAATLAHFAVASTTSNLFDAVARQPPVPDLALDENAERFLVHCGLAGQQRATTRLGVRCSIRPLEFPRGKATDVNVMPVKATRRPVACE
jgi:hypothetical protein